LIVYNIFEYAFMNRALYKFSIIIIICIFVQFMTVVSILVVWSVIIAYK